MDAFSDPAVEEIDCMTSSQIGKTEVLNNAVGYFIDQDPSPMLLVQPSLDVAKSWSKDRLEPMLRDTPCLRGKVKEVRSKERSNTILHKQFFGGHITMAGANSAASLAARPIRVVLCDEVDRYPASAGPEGDPVNLARKRATTFWNRKIGLTSTPTVKGLSRIEAAYEASDKRKFHLPCPHCGGLQVLKWRQVKWPEGEPWAARYECELCHGAITDADKVRMIRLGQWIAEKPFSGKAGFWINELYSPWSSFAKMALDFVAAKKSPQTLKVWVNTSLGECWEEAGDKIDEHSLMHRAEEYMAVPMGAGVLTCGCDVQIDCIVCEVAAWGRGEESWSIEFVSIWGDPVKEKVWQELDTYLSRTWPHESGAQMRLDCTLIDSGFKPEQVTNFVHPRGGKRIFASKGESQPGQPILGSKPAMSSRTRTRIFRIGTDTAKDLIFSRLKLDEPGPGYMHFPLSLSAEYYEQLTAEKAVTVYKKGFPHRVWEKIRTRNEALDCRVLAYAALLLDSPMPAAKIEKRLAYYQTILQNGPPPITGGAVQSQATEHPKKERTGKRQDSWIPVAKGWLRR